MNTVMLLLACLILCEGVWLRGSWCIVALEAASALPSFITPSCLINQQFPSSSLALSFHLCHYCPLSNLITQALYPHPCLSFLSLLPSCLHPRPWLAAVARHQGQISLSLPSSIFLFPPSIDSTFPAPRHCSQISVCPLARYILFVVSSSCEKICIKNSHYCFH